jgi:hypothetical protein
VDGRARRARGVSGEAQEATLRHVRGRAASRTPRTLPTTRPEAYATPRVRRRLVALSAMVRSASAASW